MIENKTGWTSASVIEFAAGADPVAKIEQKARQAVLDAADQGWGGAPVRSDRVGEYHGYLGAAERGIGRRAGILGQ